MVNEIARYYDNPEDMEAQYLGLGKYNKAKCER